MGMKEAFSPAADFSGITGGRDLMISTVVHKAFVDVTSKGQKRRRPRSWDLGPRPRVERSRLSPSCFAPTTRLFLIRDNRSGAILFMGRLTDPAH